MGTLVKQKKCILLAIVLFSLSVLSSCIYKFPVSESIKLKVCGSYALPGMIYSDMKGDVSDVEILEKDSEGRILFEYTAPNRITAETEKRLVICQKYDSKNVYFYEDICYLPTDYDDLDIITLKEQNDWSKPLDDSKMTKRGYVISGDLIFHIVTDEELRFPNIKKEIKKTCYDIIGVAYDDLVEIILTDVNYSGQKIFFLVSNDEIVECFLVFVDLNYELSYLRIDNEQSFNEQLISFKQNCNWIYN